MLEQELKTKKLMTVVKSKYFMLKVNYPKLAEKIDNEPLFDETPLENFTSESNNNTAAGLPTPDFTSTRETTLMPKMSNEEIIGEATKEEKQALFDKDRKASELIDK